MKQEIDPKDTNRAIAIELWTKSHMPMVINTKTFDVTRLRKVSRRRGMKFNMLLCWCIGRAAPRIEEFYMLPQNDKLYRYDRMAVNVFPGRAAKNHQPTMNKVRITAVRQTVYEDLMAQYENPIEHTCDVTAGQQWISINGQCPEGMCPSAWESMRPFVESLARGEGNFYDGWMKNPMSAMISCNDGFRPFSFYIEVMNESV